MNKVDENIEKLAAEVHQLYCNQYKIKTGEDYWTGGDYSKLDEPTKEQDRVIVRWHLEKLNSLLEEVAVAVENLKDTTEDASEYERADRLATNGTIKTTATLIRSYKSQQCMTPIQLLLSLWWGVMYSVIWYEISVSIPQAAVIGVLFTMTYLNHYRIQNLTAKSQ